MRRKAEADFPYKCDYHQPTPEPPSKRSRQDPSPGEEDHTTTGEALQEPAFPMYKLHLPNPPPPLLLIVHLRMDIGPTGPQKYSVLVSPKVGISSWPAGVCGSLMSASKSASSWNRYSSALKCLDQFATASNLPLTWPVSRVFLRNFVQWALLSKKLTPATLKLYLSDIKTAHKIKDVHTEYFSDFFVNSMLRGASNLALYNSISSRADWS